VKTKHRQTTFIHSFVKSRTADRHKHDHAAGRNKRIIEHLVQCNGLLSGFLVCAFAPINPRAGLALPDQAFHFRGHFQKWKLSWHYLHFYRIKWKDCQLLFLSPWRKDFRADSLHGHTKRLCADPILARPKRCCHSPKRLWRSLRTAPPLSSRIISRLGHEISWQVRWNSLVFLKVAMQPILLLGRCLLIWSHTF